MWPFQEKMVKTIVDNRYTICKLARQVGKSITVAATLLWYTIFNKNFNIAVLAQDKGQAMEILDRIQIMYEQLPKWMQHGVVEWNKGSIELENGSKIFTSATTPGAIRGKSLNIIYLDEFCFVDPTQQENFFRSAFPTISSGKTTKMIITSTPNGLDYFYKIWTDSEDGKNNFKRVESHWSDVPGRDEEWKAEQIRNTSERHFAIEFNTEFIGSSSTLIDGYILRKIPIKDPIDKLSNDNLKIYKQAKPKTTYAMTVDVSRGLGLDSSVFIVFDISKVPYEVVAVYKNNDISQMLFPNVIVNVAKQYNNAYILVETNDNGGAVAEIIRSDLDYEHILYTHMAHGTYGQTISAGFGTASRLGVKTSQVTKRVGCGNLKTLVELDKLILNSYDILFELSRFVSDGKNYKASEGHDDLCMCLVLFGWMMTQNYMRDINDLDVRQSVVMDQEEDTIAPFALGDGFDIDPNDGWMIDQEKLQNRLDSLFDLGWATPKKGDWDW